jgi:uncharacterized protein YukE
MPDVHSAIESLASSNEDIHSLLEQLSGRLDAVLRPATPDHIAEKVVGYATPLADRIESHAHSLRGACATIRSILDRLEV